MIKGKVKIKVILVAGARPNFMKIAPLIHEMKKHEIFDPLIVHTGQHYDEKMSELFFEQLNIPEPDINLEVGSASHAVQTARIMERFEKVCLDEKPDAVLVVGDVNSTAACVLVASKLNIKTIHYEAGLRSFDRTMPEEINRMVTDSICDYFFTTAIEADKNLLREGKDKKTIFMCGNLMIDSLINNLELAKNVSPEVKLKTGKKINPLDKFSQGNYGIMTIHRPSNVDNKEHLTKLVDIWGEISEKIPLIFPAHPRTWKNINTFRLKDKCDMYKDLLITEPLGYLEFIKLVKNSKFVLTDSGGIQEETTWLNIPCLTLRDNTERPVTITRGSNKLVSIHDLKNEAGLILQGKGKSGRIPKFWDGKSANRIIKILIEKLCV